jgi:predicted regulator of Ras-like GTPase activity (Roadblock/LC7/MglB family)
MPYQALLEDLVGRLRGAQAALLLDFEGEVVVQAGARDERLRLIGAYQGIALATARRILDRYERGEPALVLCRYATGTVILRPLRDGYYLVLALTPEASLAHGLRHSAEASERLRAEL